MQYGGTINLKVGETLTVHTLQNNYALAIEFGGEAKVSNLIGKYPEGVLYAKKANLVKYGDRTYCQEVALTGMKEGTVILVYQTNPFSPAYYKVIIGAGKNTPTATNDAEKADTAKKEEVTTKVEEKPAANVTAGGSEHTVQLGDTFGKLALNYFGDMNCWPAIYTYNEAAIAAAPNKQIYEGMALAIPSAVDHNGQIIQRIPAAVAGAGETLYTVKAGDTYGTIALAHFETTERYQEIFTRNADRIKDINTLYEGQIIVLP